MVRCQKCDLTVFTPRCPVCGRATNEQDEIAAGFLEFLTGKCERPDPEPPRPYRQRLASFLQCDEADVMSGTYPHTSTMPLRIDAPMGPHRGTRPPWLIRFVLKRIRAFVGFRGRERLR